MKWRIRGTGRTHPIRHIVRPLALPVAYQIPPISSSGKRRHLLSAISAVPCTTPPPAGVSGGAIKLELGARTGTMPAIGLIIAPEEADATLSAKSVLSRSLPQELLFHLDPGAGHGVEVLKRFAAIAAAHRGRSTLE